MITEAHTEINKNKTDTSKRKLKMRRLTKKPHNSDILKVDDSMTSLAVSKDGSKSSVETSLEDKTSSLNASISNEKKGRLISNKVLGISSVPVQHATEPIDTIEIDTQTQAVVKNDEITNSRQVGKSEIVQGSVTQRQLEENNYASLTHNQLPLAPDVRYLPTKDLNERGFECCCSVLGTKDGSLKSLKIKLIFQSKSEEKCANLVCTGEHIHFLDYGVTMHLSPTGCGEVIIKQTSEGQTIISMKKASNQTNETTVENPTDSANLVDNAPTNSAANPRLVVEGIHSVKQNTASEDTTTGPYKITVSVEKEMSREMECADDMDIFSGSVVEGTHPTQRNEKLISNAQVTELKHKNGSEILTQRYKRDRKSIDEFSENSRKKIKNANENQKASPENSQTFDIPFRSHQHGDKNTEVQSKEPNAMGYDTPKTRHDGSDDSDGIIEETPQKLKKTLITLVRRRSFSTVVSNSSINETIRKNVDAALVADLSKETLSRIHPPESKQMEAEIMEHDKRSFAKKSLDFGNSDSDTSPAAAKTTLKRKCIERAFETMPNIAPSSRQSDFTLACSLLSPADLTFVKDFASMKKWRFLEKVYSPELTHLIVRVDESNRVADRSLKYMCALAAGKWIVSFCWIEECIFKRRHCDETPYEVLDTTGENGPCMSRVSTRKLFTGITFYCVPPFTTIDLRILEGILVSSGGRCSTRRQVSVSDAKGVVIALVDPASTEEEHIYTVLKDKVVPVVLQWVFNCLGTYSLRSVKEFLLCPATIIPFDRLNWPEQLLEEPNTEISL